MLTDKKKMFFENYKLTLNAAESARRSGYSHKTAAESGSRLLRDKDVKPLIDAWKAEEQAKNDRIKRSRYSNKEHWLEEAATRANESTEPYKSKYFEMYGKAQGYLKENDGNQKDQLPLFVQIVRELNTLLVVGNKSPETVKQLEASNEVIEVSEDKEDTDSIKEVV